MRMWLVVALLVMPLVQTAAQDELPWYRAQIPEITAERWTEPVAPIPPPRTITRDDYMEYILRDLTPQLEYYGERAGSPDLKGQYVHARREAFLYRATGDEQHARKAMEFIRGDLAYWSKGGGVERGTGFNVLMPALEAYQWIADSPSLTDEDRETCLQWFLTIEQKAELFEYGAMNRSAGWAVARDILARMYPDLPGNDERRAYADTVWEQWWPFRDSAENAEGYNALWLSYVIPWAEARGMSLWEDEEFRALCYRFLDQVTPMGVMAPYGDVPGFNSHVNGWAEMLEIMATHLRDGRFRWAAHRLFEWTVAREEDMLQWGNINHNLADGLMVAWLEADDTLAPIMPDRGSVVTSRQQMVFVPKEERQQTMRHDRLLEGEVPNKLIMRTGWEPDASFAMVELCRPMGHGHSDTGGINCYISRGSALLSDTPYLVKDHRWHNCFGVEQWPQPEGRWRWRADEFEAMATSVERFETSALGTSADLRITDYMQQPMTLQRRLFMLGDAGIWVEDTVEATAPCSVRIGPAYQTVATHGARGENWINTCHPTIPVAFIWELQYMMQWSNRPQDLLIYFQPTAAGEMAVEDVTQDDTLMIVNQPLMNNLKQRIAWREVAELVPGEPRTFTSVLVPHAPTPDATPLASGIACHAGEGWSAVSAPGAAGEVWALRNDTGGRVEIGPLVTDAERALISLGDGAPKYWLVDATLLQVADETIFQAAAPTTVCECD